MVRRTFLYLPYGSKNVYSIDVQPNKTVLSGDVLGRVHLLDLRNNGYNFTFSAHGSAVTCLKWLNNFKATTGSSDGTVRIWDTRNTHVCLYSLIGHTIGVSSMALVGNDLVTGGGNVKVWYPDPLYCKRVLNGGKTFALTTLQDGNVASGARNGKVTIFNTNNGDVHRTFREHAVAEGDVVGVARI